MVLKIRMDIFEDRAISADMENVMKKKEDFAETEDIKKSRSVLKTALIVQELNEKIQEKADEAKEKIVTNANVFKNKACLRKLLEDQDITIKNVKLNSSLEISNKRNIDPALQDDEEEEEEWFNARTMILDMERRGIKRTKLDTTAIETSMKRKQETQNVIENIKETTKFPEKTILTQDMKFSNNMKDKVRTLCQICQSAETFSNMRFHVRNRHKMNISEYRLKHGSVLEHMVEAVYHKCGICSQPILLDGDGISVHVKGQHHMTHKEYSAKYLTLTKKYDRDLPAKKSYKTTTVQKSVEDVSIRNLSPNNSPDDIQIKPSSEDLTLQKSYGNTSTRVVPEADLPPTSYQDVSAHELLAQLEHLVNTC